MTSPQLLYYAEQASKIPPAIPKFHHTAPTDLAPAQGVANGLGYSLMAWLAVGLLFLLLVRW